MFQKRSSGVKKFIKNVNWKKAEQNGPKNTAAGPDEIPVSLINQLGPQGMTQLTGALEQVINTKKIQMYWPETGWI